MDLTFFIQTFLSFNVYVLIQTLTNLANFNLVGKLNFRNSVRTFITMDKIGLILCFKECQLINMCGAVNYKRYNLVCELVERNYRTSELKYSVDWQFISKQEMNQVSAF